MGIDGIGKRGGLPPAPEAGASGVAGAKGTAGPEKVFEVERAGQAGEASSAAGAARAAGAEAASTATPLARLRAGEIDVHGFIDLKVDEAVKGLDGLGPSALEQMKGVLRDQLRSDPGMVELVRAATGKTPSPPED